MTRRPQGRSNPPTSIGPKATTPLAREQQLIAKAVDLAEQQLADGTASAQVITHFLKLGSSREVLEQERLQNENVLLRAKKEAMDSQARIEEMYGAALNAMRSYAGQPIEEPLQMGGGDDAEDF